MLRAGGFDMGQDSLDLLGAAGRRQEPWEEDGTDCLAVAQQTGLHGWAGMTDAHVRNGWEMERGVDRKGSGLFVGTPRTRHRDTGAYCRTVPNI